MKLEKIDLHGKGSFESLEEDTDHHFEQETDKKQQTHNTVSEIDISDGTSRSYLSSFDQIDPNNIPEFQPM